MSIPKPKIIIVNSKGQKLETILKNGKWGEGVYKLIDVADFIFDENSKVRFSDIEAGNEIILKVTDGKNNKRTFYYWVESVTSHFEKGTKEHESINEVIIKATSYPSILTRNLIEGTYKFSKGYGQIVIQFAKKHGFKTTNVKLLKKKGLIHFKRMTILEAIRRMASLEGWCFYFRDKNIIFQPCTPPENSGVVITDKEIINGTFTK